MQNPRLIKKKKLIKKPKPNATFSRSPNCKWLDLNQRSIRKMQKKLWSGHCQSKWRDNRRVVQVPLKKNKSCFEGREANILFMSDKNQKAVHLTKVLWVFYYLDFCLFIIFVKDNNSTCARQYWDSDQKASLGSYNCYQIFSTFQGE